MTAADWEAQDYSKLVERYRRLREISYRLHAKPLLAFVSKGAFEAGAAKLGMKSRDGTIVFDNEDQMGILADYCLYDYVEEGGTAVSRYRAQAQPESGSDEAALLQALSESFHTLAEVTEVVPGVGVRAADLLAGRREYLVTDMGLGRTARKSMVLAARLLPLAEFAMTSGAGLLVDPATLREIRTSVLPRHGTEQGGQCLLAGGRQRAGDLSAAIIRLCLAGRAAGEMRYEEAEAGPVTAPVRREARVGRNDPCPCGSGRKYKHCHGRHG
jgi:SEC-C motif